MLLINFIPEEYDEHLRRWAHWKQCLSGSSTDLGGGVGVLANRQAGTAIGGREDVLRPPTARGKQTRTPGVTRHFCPEGYDTEQALDFVIAELAFMYPAAMQVVESNFTHQGPVQVKARQAGFSYSDYRRKLHEGKMLILVAMRFFTIKKPKAFKH